MQEHNTTTFNPQKLDYLGRFLDHLAAKQNLDLGCLFIESTNTDNIVELFKQVQLDTDTEFWVTMILSKYEKKEVNLQVLLSTIHQLIPKRMMMELVMQGIKNSELRFTSNTKALIAQKAQSVKELQLRRFPVIPQDNKQVHVLKPIVPMKRTLLVKDEQSTKTTTLLPKKRTLHEIDSVEGIFSFQFQLDIFSQLPIDVTNEILSHLSMQELLVASLVCKYLNELAGNEVRWKELALDLTLPEPNPLLQQTYKSVIALHFLGSKKCQKCGMNTKRKPLPNWNIVVCRTCQDVIAVNKTKAKQLYLLSDKDLTELSTSIANSTRYQPRTIMYLRHQLMEVARKKWMNKNHLAMAIEKRQQIKTKRLKTRMQNQEIENEVNRYLYED